MNPLAKHFRKYTCGSCGSLVGDGCFTRRTERGHDVIVCQTCASRPEPAKAAPDTIVGRAGGEVGIQIRAALTPLLETGAQRLGSERQALVVDLERVGGDLVRAVEGVLERQRQAALDDVEGRLRALVGISPIELQRQPDGSWAEPSTAIIPGLRREANELVATALLQARACADQAVDRAGQQLEAWRRRLLADAEAAVERQRVALVASGEAAGQRLTDRAMESLAQTASGIIAQAEERIRVLREEIQRDLGAQAAAILADADRMLAARWAAIAGDGHARIDATIDRARDQTHRLVDDGLAKVEVLLERRARTELRTAAWLMLILAGGVAVIGAASLTVSLLHRWLLA